MKLNFGKLYIHNFKSFLDETFDFSSKNGLTLVCGKNHDIPGQANSAGKSSIFDALLYALFGQLQTNVKNKNLKNRYSNESSMFVIVDFNIDGKSFYSIERGLSKYNTSYLKIFSVNQETNDKSDITKSSIQETEKFLEEELLHCDVSLFLRTILLSSDQNYNFFLLSKGDKKDFVEKLFNIKVFGEMCALIHKDILNFEKDFSTKQTTLLMLNKTKNDLEDRISKFVESKKKQILELEKKIDSFKQSLKEFQSKQIHVNNDEVNKIESTINKFLLKKDELNNEIKNMFLSEKKLISTKAKLESLKTNEEKTILSHKELLEKLCDKCLPVILEYYNITNIKQHILEIKNQIVEVEKKLNDISEKTKLFSTKIEKIDLAVNKLESKIHEMVDEYNKNALEISNLNTSISINSINLKKIENEENPFSTLYEDTYKKINSINSEISDMNVEYNYLKMAENIVSQDTLKKFIVKDLVNLLNSKIKYYLMKLGAKYTCIFNEDMDYTFITPDGGGETEYATFSAGERMRLSIASSFAFRDFMSLRNGFMSNILILDEFIDSAIDTLAVNNVLKLLQEFSRLNNQHIMIISHRKEIDNSIFDNIIMVEKTNNISKITYLESEK